MKASITRILSLLLVAMMAIAIFAGCTQQPKDTTPTDVTPTETTPESVPEPVIVGPEDDDPYTISKDADGKDVVILTPNDDGTATMNVAEGTTLEQFFTLVTAKEGYTQKVTDAEGNEVTDPAALIADGMTYAVYADGETDPAKQFAIHVESQEKIEETVSQAAVVSQQIAKAEEGKKSSGKGNGNKGSGKGNGKTDSSKNTKSSTPSKTGESSDTSPGNPSQPAETNIVLGSIWSDRYVASDDTGNTWQSTFSSIKKKFNINTSTINLNGNNAADIVVKEVMAGKSTADVWETSAYICRTIARKNALMDMKSIGTLNWSAYANAATESMTFGGKVYGVAIPFNATKPMGVIYNKELIKKYAPEYDIDELYNTHKWTFDIFRIIAKKCTRDTNGDNRSDVYGFTSNTNIIGMALTSNAGGTALMKNGRVEATMCNDEGVVALEWMKTMYKEDKSWLYCADIRDSVNKFANGEAAMFASWMSYYNDIAPKADFTFGFVLMPMGPDQKEYISGQYDARFYMVPKTANADKSAIGNFINGLSAASSKLINVELKNQTRNGLGKTSQDIYKWCMSNATPEYSSGLFSKEISQAVDNSVTSASKSPSKVMSSIKNKAQAELDDFFGPLY